MSRSLLVAFLVALFLAVGCGTTVRLITRPDRKTADAIEHGERTQRQLDRWWERKQEQAQIETDACRWRATKTQLATAVGGTGVASAALTWLVRRRKRGGQE